MSVLISAGESVTVRPEQLKALKEKTIEKLISLKLGLVNSKTAEGDSFFFKPHAGPDKVFTRTIIQFRGPNKESFKEQAIILLRSDRHRATDCKFRGSFVIHLDKIEPAPFDSVYGRSEEKPNTPVVHSLNGLSASEVLRVDPALQRGLETVDLLHARKLLLGVKNKKGEIVFLPSQSSDIAVEYNYINKAELLYVRDLCKKLTGYEPQVRRGNRDGEEVVLQFDLSLMSVINLRKLKQRDTRIIEHGILASDVAEFVINKMLRSKASARKPLEGQEYVVFHTENGKIRDAAFKKLQEFEIRYKADLRDERCFRIHKADQAGSIPVVNTQSVTTSKTTMAEQVSSGAPTPALFDRARITAMIKAAMKKNFDWKAEKEYGIAPSKLSKDGTLLYVTINTKTDDDKKILRDNLKLVQSDLPEGVEASFQGLAPKATSLFFFFPNRESVIKKLEESKKATTDGKRSTKPEQSKPAVATTTTSKEEPLPLRLLRAMIGELDDSHREKLVEILGGNNKKQEGEALQVYKKNLQAKLADYQLIRTEDPRVKMIMGFADPSIFKDPVEVLKDILK